MGQRGIEPRVRQLLRPTVLPLDHDPYVNLSCLLCSYPIVGGHFEPDALFFVFLVCLDILYKFCLACPALLKSPPKIAHNFLKLFLLYLYPFFYRLSKTFPHCSPSKFSLLFRERRRTSGKSISVRPLTL